MTAVILPLIIKLLVKTNVSIIALTVTIKWLRYHPVSHVTPIVHSAVLQLLSVKNVNISTVNNIIIRVQLA